LIVACAWRVHHGGYITDAVAELYRTLVRYAPEGDIGGPHEVTETNEGPLEHEAAPAPETYRFRITIRNTAGRVLENGNLEPIVASRGRVFYLFDETIGWAIAKFCNTGIAATDRYPASPILLTDFDIVPADESDIPAKAIENWTGSRPG
jgi:hypothetical protein